MPNHIDLDKQFHKYIVNEFDKLSASVIEFNKLDSRDKLNYLIDLGYHDNDSGTKDADDYDHDGFHDNGVTHIDSPSYDDLDGLVGNNPYNH